MSLNILQKKFDGENTHHRPFILHVQKNSSLAYQKYMPLIPELERKVDFCEFKGSLGYIMSFSIAGAT